jgi:hypothetical protein
MPPPTDPPDVARAATLARWLDLGLVDPIIGLILPGAGDLIGSGAGLYTVAVAVRRKLPAVVVARMLLNLGVDAGLGSIPLLGDLFDLVHKANLKNVALLRQHAGGGRSTARDWAIVAGAALLFVAALAVPVVLLVWAVARLAR